MTFRATGLRDDAILEGDLRGVEVDGTPVVLLRAGGRVCAYVDRCAHRGVHVSGGRIDRGVLFCPRHGWAYDAETGESINPRGSRLARLDVAIEGAEVCVRVASEPR